MPPIKGAIVRFCSNGDSYGFPQGEYLWSLANICVEADVLWPRPVEIGDEHISTKPGRFS
ncbi:hypothetical protein MES5069_230040 [Mesorhizobium escarrei]|uniref:Uncharacterized protein n=1 Tax=Mesorhizobium escarrei TaxID=666018 RepID=A0ABM9DSE7_9HYPH|nr:hypothetical protein MES5069_230040 [Mesorhizobium escarrei]